ncbi:MAG: right-handed parallel beta-helix repeat-containing protein [Candidatus Hydrogenedentes bacterium]|nr:right-handed parallel beta-helix repeat-containing protein [Candidatus Hydrogenedentota bacterium]
MKRISAWFVMTWMFAWVAQAATPSVGDYPTVQAALDAHPGMRVFLPAGVWKLDQPVMLRTAGSGLYGPGTLQQSNPGAAVVRIDHADDVSLQDLIVERVHEENATEPSVLIDGARRATLSNVTVRNHRARNAAIEVRSSENVTIRGCLVHNYKCIAIDDRTASELYGYAFRAIDGTGILVQESTGTIIESNRVIEDRYLPTKAQHDQYGLGEVTVRPAERGRLMPQEAWEQNYVSNWHQGSAIVVTSPKATHHTIIRGNVLQHCAQGIDIHSDMVICADNIVDHGMMGVKMTHGSRNIIVKNNLLTHIDLWGILVNPGAASSFAAAATGETPAQPSNHDSGILISGNQITDFGYGDEYWNWGGKHEDGGSSFPIAILEAQLPEQNPRLSDILIEGNLVYDAGRDASPAEAPRHRYAVYIAPKLDDPHAPVNVRVVNNIFHAGRSGVSNEDLERLGFGPAAGVE